VGLINVFTTHLAASEDFGDYPYHSPLSFAFPSPGIVTFDVACPAACDPAQTMRACEAVQVANFVKARHTVSTPAFLTGVYNAAPRVRITCVALPLVMLVTEPTTRPTSGCAGICNRAVSWHICVTPEG
jgi:hypothetical protein